MSLQYDEVCSAYDPKIKFITGFAGSGKSTRLVSQLTDSTLVLCPTHEACRVLQRKGAKHAYTIHSVLKLVPTIDKEFRKGQKMQKLTRIGSTDLSSIKHIFIDEFSMINTAILDMLLSVLPAEAEVVVFGDPYQLPPVDGEPIDPLAYTEDIEELTVQHRAEAPEVVETFMRFMRYIKDGSETNLRLNPAIKHGDLKLFDPKTDRILAYTNERVLELNAQAAKILGMPAEIAVDESLLVNDIVMAKTESNYEMRTIYPSCISKGALKTGEDLDNAIATAEDSIERFNVSLYGWPEMYVNGYRIYYDLDHYKTQQRLKKELERAQFFLVDHHKIGKDVKLAEWCRNNPSAEGVRDRARAWSAYLNHTNYVFSVRRPFATTVHKAQGREFDTVFIDVMDMKRSIRSGYYGQYARLMYVALSRAIKRIIIL